MSKLILGFLIICYIAGCTERYHERKPIKGPTRRAYQENIYQPVK